MGIVSGQKCTYMVVIVLILNVYKSWLMMTAQLRTMALII